MAKSLYEAVAIRRVRRHLRNALMEAQLAMTASYRLPSGAYGRTYGLTQGAVDALIDAFNESKGEL